MAVIAVGLMLAVPALSSDGGPTIASDLADYNPGQTVTLNGSGWGAGEAVHIRVAENNTNVTWSLDSNPDPVANGSGNLIYTFKLPDTFIASYNVTATGQTSGTIATTTFTDANPSASLDQCQNGPAPSPNNDGCDSDPTDWARGNLNQAKSNYFEGDSIPYRLSFDNLSLAGHAVTISWDTTKSGKHALDYLTSYNASVLNADPCVGRTCGAAFPYLIPKDPQVDTGGLPITQPDGYFTLYGGTITTTSGYSYSPAGFAGDTTASITIFFTANVPDPVLAWGGHIATRANWGADASAVAIPGSPYHTSLVDLDTKGGGQDTQLSAQAVTFPGSIKIIKQASPEGSTSFPFTATPSPLSNFSLTDDGTSANTKLFSNITNFQTYTVGETIPTNWTLNSIQCAATSPNGGGTTNSNPLQNVQINMKEGENWTCTFNDSQDTGKLEVVKDLNPSTDPGRFNLQIDGTTEKANAGDGDTTGEKTLTAGNHTVGEIAGTTPATSLANYQKSIECRGNNGAGSVVAQTSGDNAGPLTVNVTKGSDIVCTITNTRETGKLEVVKDLNPSTDPGRFNLQIDGTTQKSNAGDGDTTGEKTLNTGNHTVGEIAGTSPVTALTKYDKSISCKGDNGTGSVVASATGAGPLTVAVGYNDDIVCTITNTRIKAKLTVAKSLTPTTDTGRFDLKIGDTVVKANAGNGDSGYQMLDPGDYTVSEVAGTTTPATSLSNYDRSLECKDSAGNVVASNSDGAAKSVSVDSGDDITCTFTNKRWPRLTVKKVVNGGTALPSAWPIHVKSGSPLADVTDVNGSPASPQNGSSTGTTYLLKPGSYTASEGSGPGGYLFKGFSGDCDATAGTVTLAYGDNKTCTLTNEQTATSAVTDSMLCQFDEDTGATGRQFRLLYTQSAQTPPYKLNASNPGQFYYNVFYNGAAGSTLTMTLPYPFITQGAMSVHFYASVSTKTLNGQTCYVPGKEIGNSPAVVTLASYGNGATFGATVSVQVPQNLLAVGFAYVNMHLDYGLKGTGPYNKDAANNAVDLATPPKILIPDKQNYTFANSVISPPSPNDTVQSLNVFKKNPGIGGLVKKAGTDQPLANVKADIYQGTKLMSSVLTDDDGYFMWPYKYTGKATTFTVKLPAYGQSKSDTLKSNGFLSMDFTTP